VLRLLFCCLFAAAVLTPLSAQQSAVKARISSFQRSGKHFALFFEQKGRVVPEKGDTVLLQREPFTLIVLLKEAGGISVNFSRSPKLFAGFKQGRTLAEIFEDPDMFMGGAEDLFNASRTVWISPTTPHFLFVDENAESHRFSSVERIDAVYVCRRQVEFFRLLGEEEESRPLRQMPSPIYVGALYSEWGDNWERIELQKESAVIRFTQ
jgi:hypothetical protein